MRDALRRNQFAHHTFNVNLELKKFTKVFDTNKVMKISDHFKYNSEIE